MGECFMEKPIKKQYTLTDRILEVAGIAITLVLVILPFAYYEDLPEQIPIHYCFRGLPDDFGNKTSIWALPVVGLVIFAGMTILNIFLVRNTGKKPSANNPEIISRENVSRLLQVIKLFLSLAFAYIVFQTIQISLERAEGLGVWFLPVFIVLMTFLPIIFLVRSAGTSGK
jgi:uncharacterized membrane protein